MNDGTPYAGSHHMQTLNRTLIRYGHAIRFAWLVITLLLVACNNGNDGAALPATRRPPATPLILTDPNTLAI